MEIETFSPEETYEMARKLGETALPGTVFCLDGDLGAGKTLFAQGLGAGLGIQVPINSPTFTVLQIYEEGRMPFYHFDVYRIGDVEEMEEIGFEEYVYGQGVSLIEWSELIADILPEHRIKVVIEKQPEKGDDFRRITVCRY